MKVALYARVSTLEQAREGYSLDAQIDKMTSYSNGMGYEIYDKYIDDGFTGKNLFRPALESMIKDIKNHKFETVIIYKLDRLSRRVKDVIELVEMFEKYNVTLFSLNENIDLSSPFGRATLKMSATFSELERETIIERMKMGKEQRARSGYAMRNHILPIGFDYDEKTKTFTPNYEAEQVKKIFELFLNGWNMASISDYMHNNYQNRYGSYNDRTAVARVINNPICCGYFFFKGEIHKGKNIIPIIDFNTWLKAKAIRTKQVLANRRYSSPYLLTGLLRCGLCGRPYVAKKHKTIAKGKYQPYYVYESYSYGCVARVKFESRYHKVKCTNVILPQNELDNIVNESIKNLKFTNYREEENVNLSYLQMEIAEGKNKIHKLLDLYESDIIDKKELEARVEKINKEITKKTELLKEESGKTIGKPKLNIDKIKEKIKNWDTLPLNEKRSILSCLIKQIVIHDDGNIKIEWLVE